MEPGPAASAQGRAPVLDDQLVPGPRRADGHAGRRWLARLAGACTGAPKPRADVAQGTAGTCADPRPEERVGAEECIRGAEPSDPAPGIGQGRGTPPHLPRASRRARAELDRCEDPAPDVTAVGRGTAWEWAPPTPRQQRGHDRLDDPTG